jgi:tetratricopeptide (TPR) repeat protein
MLQNLLAALLALAQQPAAPDIVCLKDGRVIQGPAMERKPGGIELSYKNGTILLPDALIEDAVLAADAQIVPADEEERAKLAKGFVRYEKKWVTVKQRDAAVQKRLEQRRKELLQMDARKEWRNRGQQDTAHFHFDYTVPDHVFETYRDLMEAYFGEFAKAWKLDAPGKENRLPVSFHGSEQTFHQVSGAGYGILGYFRFVKPWDLNIFYERLDTKLTTEVMFHEANHYLQQLIDLEFAVPHFPGESLAEYYGASSWDPEKKKLTTGLIQEGRLCEIQAEIDAGEMMDLERLVKTERMYQHYNWGWALVHFLMNDKRYAPKFQKFVFTLAKGKNVKREPMGMGSLTTVAGAEVLRVFMEELGLKDREALKKLEQEWHVYIKTNLKNVSVTGLEKAGFAAVQEGRRIRGLRLLKEAVEKGSRNPLVYHRLAELNLGNGKHEEALAAWREALQIDPLNGQFYSALGHALVRGADGKQDPEAQRLIALAKELGYDEPWSELDFSKDDEKK